MEAMEATTFRFKRGQVVRMDRGTRKVAVILGDSRSEGKYRVAVWSNAAYRWCTPRAAKVTAPGGRGILGVAREGDDASFNSILRRALGQLKNYGMPDERGAR